MTEKEKVVKTLREHRAEFAQYSVRRLAIFGSAARDELGPDSDIDVLVEFETPTFRKFMRLALYLEELLGRKVDLATNAMLRPQMRERIDAEAVIVA